MQLIRSKTSLAMLLIAVLFACRMSCLAFASQQDSGGGDAHSCCHKTQKEQNAPAKSDSNCKADIFETAVATASVALEPSLEQAVDAVLVQSSEELEAACSSPIHSPPDLLALYHILLI